MLHKLWRLPSALPQALLFVIIICWAALYAVLSATRYAAYNAGMLDLGNMTQAIWSVLDGSALRYTQPPVSAVSRLSGHVEIIYVLFAPLLHLWPDPRVLLIAQAVLAASGALPVYRIASRRVAPHVSLWFALGYLLYPTAVAAVLFDFHGDTLAMPLLLWMLDALDARAWLRFWGFLVLSLLCKFYVAAPIFVLGMTLWFDRGVPLGLATIQRRRRLALAICAVAAGYGATTLFVIRPAFAVEGAGGNAAYISHYFGGYAGLNLLDLLDRAVNLMAVLLPSALLWWWARGTALPAFAIIAPALLSTGPGGAHAWSYHHYAVAVPFIVVASIDGAARRSQRIANVRLRQREARLAAALFCGVTLVFHVGLNDTPLGIAFWRSAFGSGMDANAYGRTSRDAFKDRWLAEQVPPHAPIAASNFLAPHLADRATLYLVRYPDEPTAARLPGILSLVDHAIADALFDYATPVDGGFGGGVRYDSDAIRVLLTTYGWGLTAAQDGLLRFDREPAAVLHQSIQPAADTNPALATFGDTIEVITGTIEPLNGRRYRATVRWRARRDLQPSEHFVAVSTIDGVADARIVHLPSYVLQPTTTWRAGQVWEEHFEFDLPPEAAAGAPTWRVGWYDTRNPYAAFTDDRSRIGALVELGRITIAPMQ